MEMNMELLRIFYGYWVFPKIRGTSLVVPITRILVFCVYIGVPYFQETTNVGIIPNYMRDRYRKKNIDSSSDVW